MVSSTKEKPEPTLAEKRNMAPMMAEGGALQERRKMRERDLQPLSVKRATTPVPGDLPAEN